jgi:hypothetical protein
MRGRKSQRESKVEMCYSKHTSVEGRVRGGPHSVVFMGPNGEWSLGVARDWQLLALDLIGLSVLGPRPPPTYT